MAEPPEHAASDRIAKKKMMRGQYHGRYCAAINCANSTQKKPGISFFSFPKDFVRCQTWVQNCRRIDLMGKSSEYLRKNCFLCAEHFEAEQFMNPVSRNKLIWSAVPSIFRVPNPPSLLVTKRRRIIKKAPILVRKAQSSSPIPSTSQQDACLDVQVAGPSTIADTPRKLKLKKRLHKYVVQNTLKKKVPGVTAPSANATATPNKIRKIVSDASLYLPENTLNFFEAQMHLFSQNTKARRYSGKMKELALSLYYLSPRAYKICSKIFALPHQRTLQKW